MEEREAESSTPGLGLVRDGTPCGDNLICINQTCTSQFPHMDVGRCPSNNDNYECSAHGVCNNLNKCHCDGGWSGPDCSLEQEQPIEPLTSSTETSTAPSAKNKMEKKETPYENYHGSNTVYLVITLMSVVGGVFVVFAMMALCYRSVVVHKNFSLCLRKKNTLQKFDPPYSKKQVHKGYSESLSNQNPEIAALDSVNKILKFGRMPHYREHKPQMKRLGLDDEDGGTGTEEVVSFIDLPPNSLAKLPEKGILKKHGGYGIAGSGTMSDVERTLNSLNGYHDEILEALRNAHRGLSSTPTRSENLLDDETIRKSLVEHGYTSDTYRKDSDSQDNMGQQEDDDEDDIPPTCGTIRIRTLEDIIRQLEHHSTRRMSPVDSEDIRVSENETDRHYRMDSSVCSESSQGSRRCSRSRDDDTRFVYGRYRQPTARSPFGSHPHSHQLHEEEGIYETADTDRNSNPRGETPDSESDAFIQAQQQSALWMNEAKVCQGALDQTLPAIQSELSTDLHQYEESTDQLPNSQRGYYPSPPNIENSVFASEEITSLSEGQETFLNMHGFNLKHMHHIKRSSLDNNFSLDCNINTDSMIAVSTNNTSDNEHTALLPSSHFPEYKH
ncbi:uncharacterized protein LOC100116487 [Nasonia vitripennis]|uniref:EGF-like domain-containing protein n=1 Tax=Nasonia vitripennis TaxID=7425 RepID=A0A7M7TED8_NASVI|nr:uncharacterized protein LOC100116487 [Nasonia vitripennis]